MMLTEFLSLLCLGLSLGFADEKKNETLPKPSLSALSSLVVGHGGNVTLRCQSHFQNVTFTLGKLQDSGYRQEQRSTGHKAEFLLTHLEPKDAGMYFCTYKTMDSQEWSGESDYLQLEVKDDLDGRGATEVKNANGLIFAATFSCLSISILFLSVVFINRCTQHGSSHEEATKRTSHSEFPKQEATDLSNLDRISVSVSSPHEVTYYHRRPRLPPGLAHTLVTWKPPAHTTDKRPINMVFKNTCSDQTHKEREENGGYQGWENWGDVG